MGLPHNIILVGFMGSGKTTTGKELSRILNYHFWDMDKWIEQRIGKKVHRIFEEDGENFFRLQERKALDWLNSKKNYVISTGGGAWTNEEIRHQLLSMGWCVWLRVSAEKALKRVVKSLSHRPLLAKSKNPLKTVEEMLAERNPVYSRAHTSFDTDDKKSREVALEIQKFFKKEHPFDLFPMQK